MITRWTTTALAAVAQKQHTQWQIETDPVDKVIAAVRCELAKFYYRRAEREEVEASERVTWPRISIREAIR
jgi:hypothetical protein